MKAIFSIIFCSLSLISSIKFSSVEDAIVNFNKYLELKLQDLNKLNVNEVAALKKSIQRYVQLVRREAMGYLSTVDFQTLRVGLDRAYNGAESKIVARELNIYIADIFSKLDSSKITEEYLSSAYKDFQNAKSKFVLLEDKSYVEMLNRALERVRLKMINFYKAKLIGDNQNYKINVDEAIREVNFQIRQIDAEIEKEKDQSKSGIDWLIDKIRSITGIKQKNINQLEVKKVNLNLKKDALEHHIEEKVSRPAEILADTLIKDPAYRYQGVEDFTRF